ncbi:MAG: hypothetical protein DYG98_01420 [Haliscomenobacteraceae bacterium CHB4]|nr:hypothetical protein [Saprospiraceae bacterium]MCE7921691.1 hypothetical protein [Haliscomenobacteraceae bacterium CHB4]
MGRIRVQVSQGGGTDDDPAILGSGPVTVTLTAETSGDSVPGGMNVSLSVNGSSVGSPQTTPTGTNPNDTLSYPFVGSAVNLPYVVTVTNAPRGTEFDGLTGNVGQSAFPAAGVGKSAAEVPAPEDTRRAMSLIQKVIWFLRRLFGQKAL